MTNSRQKGASAEREVAKLLFEELGMTFKRDLRQYQGAEHGDLITDDCAFPFLIEIKRYAKGWTCKPAWEVQAFAAAKASGQYPCVVYRHDGQQWRVRVWIDAIGEAVGSRVVAGVHCDTNIQGFAWLVREILARRNEQKPGSIPTDQGLLPRCAPASTEQQQQSEAAYGANTCKS